MKLWQLLAVLATEQTIIDKYFSNIDLSAKGKSEVDHAIVLEALGASKSQYYVTSDNYLRIMPEVGYLSKQGINTVEILSALDAYKKFGGDAITEVVDYGSYNLATR